MKKRLGINTMIMMDVQILLPEQSRYKHDADLDNIINDHDDLSF